MSGGSTRLAMRQLLARRLVAPSGGRLIDVGGEDALVAGAVLAQDPSCDVLLTCGDLRSYRAVKREADGGGGPVGVALADGLEDVEESGWDAVCLTLSLHLPPVVGDRLAFEGAARAADDAVLWLVSSRKAGKRARATASRAFGPGQKVGSSGGQRVDRYGMSDRAGRLADIRQQADDLAREERLEVWLELPHTRLRFGTRVGVFACRAVDPGTKLLLAWALKQPEPKRVLDVGCGYGVIGVAAAATWRQTHAHLVDVEVRSVRLAEANAELNGLTNCTVSLADAAADLPANEYDLALSNVPAHESRELTLSLLEGLRRALRPLGTFAAVVPVGSGLRQLVEQTFGHVQVVTRGPSYEVLVTAGNR